MIGFNIKVAFFLLALFQASAGQYGPRRRGRSRGGLGPLGPLNNPGIVGNIQQGNDIQYFITFILISHVYHII